MTTVTSHGTDIYYESWGLEKTPSTQTLIFAHGMGGNAGIWFNQIEHFMDDYHIIAFDHRYFGRSSCDPDQFDPALFPDDVMAIMDATDVSSAIFICQSMGGWTGSQMAVHHPDRTDGLLMSHTPGIFQHATAVNSRDVNKVATRPMGKLESPAFAADFSEKNRTSALLYAQISAFNNIDPTVITGGIGNSGLGVDTETLSNYAVPTCFITGDEDAFFAADYVEALAASLKGATCKNMGNVGHSSYFETPATFNSALEEFLLSVTQNR